ncbi:hypothetical protein CEXT_794851 [Caerostris extrusa]|uniref:Uncharacterized protein n=1 Tax=Caerostris extrusa TaxID=172846 RepID=A0AAV4Q274_CAEEX|nr:hypothetical protein CEXT_794851 [Caerostris extrusa]
MYSEYQLLRTFREKRPLLQECWDDIVSLGRSKFMERWTYYLSDFMNMNNGLIPVVHLLHVFMRNQPINLKKGPSNLNSFIKLENRHTAKPSCFKTNVSPVFAANKFQSLDPEVQMLDNVVLHFSVKLQIRVKPLGNLKVSSRHD